MPKGAGQALYGSQTIGAVIKWITPSPSESLRGLVDLSAGDRGCFIARAHLGQYGLMVDLMRKQGEGARANAHSELSGTNLKEVVPFHQGHPVTLRLSRHAEDSRGTHTGLTLFATV